MIKSLHSLISAVTKISLRLDLASFIEISKLSVIFMTITWIFYRNSFKPLSFYLSFFKKLCILCYKFSILINIFSLFINTSTAANTKLDFLDYIFFKKSIYKLSTFSYYSKLSDSFAIYKKALLKILLPRLQINKSADSWRLFWLFAQHPNVYEIPVDKSWNWMFTFTENYFCFSYVMILSIKF